MPNKSNNRAKLDWNFGLAVDEIFRFKFELPIVKNLIDYHFKFNLIEKKYIKKKTEFLIMNFIRVNRYKRLMV